MGTTIANHEIKCDYVIIDTGYTSRLIDTFNNDPGNRTLYSEVTVVCIKDELWGTKNRNTWASWAMEEEAGKLKSMLATLDVDGVIVFKMGSKKSPFYASSHFHSEYGSGTDNRYCGSFDGVPDAMSVFEHKGLGTIVFMAFDTESG